MLTKDCFLPSLVQLSKPASLLTSIGFYWDPFTSQMYRLESKPYFIHRVSTKTHFAAILLILLQTAFYPEKSNRARMMISSFGLIVVVFCGITVQVYHRNLGRCVALINELVNTSEHLREKGKQILDTKEKLIKLLAPTLHWSAMSVPFAFVGGVVWSMPCMPSNLGYFLLNECSTTQSTSKSEDLPPLQERFVKLVFIISNLWLWSYGVQCAVFVVIVVMLGAMSIRSFLKFYKRKMLESTAKVPASWKRNVLKYDPQVEKRLVYKNALLYRRIQLLTDRFNKIHQLKILVPLLFTVTSHQVFSVYGAIKFNGQLNFVSYALFVILGSQGVLVIMGMFTGLADVYTMSKGVKGRLEKSHRNHKFLKRFHLSCFHIKIRFGSLNYIDSFTPLAFENFALVQATNMLMT